MKKRISIKQNPLILLCHEYSDKKFHFMSYTELLNKYEITNVDLSFFKRSTFIRPFIYNDKYYISWDDGLPPMCGSLLIYEVTFLDDVNNLKSKYIKNYDKLIYYLGEK